jgi:hypothetical protein
MPQIAECFPRCVEITDLSESVHARWRHFDSYRLEMGIAIIHSVVEAVQSQVVSTAELYCIFSSWLIFLFYV